LPIACPTLVQACTPSAQPTLTFVSSNNTYTYNTTTPANSVATGVLTFKIKSNGGNISLITSDNVVAQVCDINGNCTSAGVSKNVTVSPNQSIPDGAEATVTVSASYTGGSGYIYFKISEIDWTINGTITRQTSGLDSYKTPAVYTFGGVATPTITVTSPNGGENWKVGETHRVTWASQGISSVYIYIENRSQTTGSGSANYITPGGLTAISAAQGYYDWTITQQQLPVGDASKYKIYIVDSATNAAASPIMDYGNDYFTISAAITTPSITVTSPNGGENWKVGETHNITWTSSNFGSMGVSINLLNPGATGAAYLKNIASNLPNTGTYQWTIPSNISGGTYNLMLVSSGGVAVQDYSDNYFNITVVSTTPCLNGSGPLLPGQTRCSTTVPSLPGAYNYSNSSLASISHALAKIVAEIQAMLNK